MLILLLCIRFGFQKGFENISETVMLCDAFLCKTKGRTSSLCKTKDCSIKTDGDIECCGFFDATHWITFSYSNISRHLLRIVLVDYNSYLQFNTHNFYSIFQRNPLKPETFPQQFILFIHLYDLYEHFSNNNQLSR